MKEYFNKYSQNNTFQLFNTLKFLLYTQILTLSMLNPFIICHCMACPCWNLAPMTAALKVSVFHEISSVCSSHAQFVYDILHPSSSQPSSPPSTWYHALQNDLLQTIIPFYISKIFYFPFYLLQ